jgi:hypothetical protein
MVEKPVMTAATPREKVDFDLLVPCNFPNKVYTMLEYSHAHDLSEVCGWNDSGTCFCITDVTRFMEELASTFFPKQSAFRAFERQLNMWGFERKAPDELKNYTFYHDCFIRNRPELKKQITRKAVTKRSSRRFNGIGINLNILTPEAQHGQRLALQFLKRPLPRDFLQGQTDFPPSKRPSPARPSYPSDHLPQNDGHDAETDEMTEETTPPATVIQIHPPSPSQIITQHEPPTDELLFSQQQKLRGLPCTDDYNSTIEYEKTTTRQKKNRPTTGAFQDQEYSSSSREPAAVGRVRKCVFMKRVAAAAGNHSRGRGIIAYRRNQDWLGRAPRHRSITQHTPWK